MFLISNSGKTKELTNLIPFLKDREVYIVALVGDPESIIAENSNSILDASVDKEICPLNLTPTASTAVAMSIGDALAVSWMERRRNNRYRFCYKSSCRHFRKKINFKSE